MALGGAFPRGMAIASAMRQLVPGAVIKILVTFEDGVEKEKRLIVTHVDDDTVVCVINSEVSPFIKARPEMLKCQVAMPAADYDFMDHDSSVDCSRVRNYSTAEVAKALADDPQRALGTISAHLRDQVVAGIKASVLIPAPEAAKCCASLEGTNLGAL